MIKLVTAIGRDPQKCLMSPANQTTPTPGLAGLALKTTPTLCVRLTDFMMEVGYRTAGEATWNMIPSGYVKIAIEHGPFIVDLPIKAGDFP